MTKTRFLTALLSGLALAAAILNAAPSTSAFTKDARILFQGDSITDGNRGRTPDPNHILGHGYAFILAAKFGADEAGKNLDFLNRGISGNTVRDLEKRWQQDTLDLKPDVLSVLIGVNDNRVGIPIDEYERLYDGLLAAARRANPKVRLILGEPFGLKCGKHKDDWETWSAGLQQRSKVVEKLARKYDAVFVPYQKAFDAACGRAPAGHWIWDGVHPTYSGHQIMADAWMDAVRAKWPAE